MIKQIKTIDEDLHKYALLYTQAFNNPPWNNTWTVKTAYNRLLEIYNTPKFLGLSFIKNGEIKGAIFGNVEQWHDGKHYNLKEMFVAKDIQGSGIGTQLLRALELKLHNANINDIFLFTSKNNGTDSFYSKNGYFTHHAITMMGKNI